MAFHIFRKDARLLWPLIVFVGLLQFAGAGESMEVGQAETKRFEAPEKFRYDVGAALRPGSVIIVTPESLHAGSTGRSQTVLEEDMPPR